MTIHHGPAFLQRGHTSESQTENNKNRNAALLAGQLTGAVTEAFNSFARPALH
jgi:hypothetical protein